MMCLYIGRIANILLRISDSLSVVESTNFSRRVIAELANSG